MFFSCEDNIEFFKQKLNNNFDVVHKYINNKQIGVLYLKTIVDEELLAFVILNKLQNQTVNSLKKIQENIVGTADAKIISSSEPDFAKTVCSEALSGKVLIFMEGKNQVLAVDAKKTPARSPTEPPSSAVILGPRIGFTENLDNNIALIRKYLPTEDLVIKEFTVGKYTKTKVLVTFINSIANAKTAKAICKKIQKINIDGIIDSNYILAYFQKNNLLFKRCGLSEKPDIVTAKLLEGRVAILVDNSPVVLTLPFFIFEDVQNSNDYYSNSVYASFLRIIRLVGVFIAAVLPGLYLSLRLYHYKVLPLQFLITISNTTEGLPFTPFLEMLFIVLLFQILYDVSLRLPQHLGLATSIVGALILGQTGVSAGLISPPAVVIVAMSIISVYTISDQIAQLSILRLIFLIIGGSVGYLGVLGFLIYTINQLARMEQYGTSYLAPYAPLHRSDLKDGIFKQPVFNMKKRPTSLKNTNKIRENTNLSEVKK